MAQETEKLAARPYLGVLYQKKSLDIFQKLKRTELPLVWSWGNENCFSLRWL